MSLIAYIAYLLNNVIFEISFIKTMMTCLTLLVGVIIATAFVTLIEQKILRSAQVRLGPNIVSLLGLLQPFADAVKLLFKQTSYTISSNNYTYSITPLIAFVLSLILWLLLPLKYIFIIFLYPLLFFILIRSLIVYPLILIGWSSNSKYSLIAALRAVAQLISYEISIAILLISIILATRKFSLKYLMEINSTLNSFAFFLPLVPIWFMCILAETNRTPYDFAEAESELVSGFNTEYASRGFILIFVSEYTRILFISTLSVALFCFIHLNTIFLLLTIFIAYLFVWVRATLPRLRYDKLIYLAWKRYLPITITILLFYISFNLL